MKAPKFVDDDLRAGLGIGLCLGAMLILLILLFHGRPSTLPAPMQEPAASLQPRFEQGHRAPAAQRRLELGQEAASSEARLLRQWIVTTGDHGGRSFVIVDKRDAKVFVFDAAGHLVGATPVLLGFAGGDDITPASAAKPLSELRPDERITPAGRFNSQAGRNAEGEDVVWVDYAAAVSMHRIRQVHAAERRLERLVSPTSADNRISSGCINVPVAFFDNVLWPRLGRGRQAVIYVLPETRPLAEVFPALTPAD